MTRGDFFLITAWSLLLGFVLARPTLANSPSSGDDLTRQTVRVALLFYAAAVILRLLARFHLAHCAWSLAWLAYLVHLGMAFHHYHHWSHDDAMRHTRAVSGVGEGIFVSHIFTVVWSLDVIFWWLRPDRYAVRSPWIDRLLHGFMAFVIFNATVVFEQGFIRWAGAALFVVLGLLWLRRLRSKGIVLYQ